VPTSGVSVDRNGGADGSVVSATEERPTATSEIVSDDALGDGNGSMGILTNATRVDLGPSVSGVDVGTGVASAKRIGVGGIATPRAQPTTAIEIGTMASRPSRTLGLLTTPMMSFLLLFVRCLGGAAVFLSAGLCPPIAARIVPAGAGHLEHDRRIQVFEVG
jgi:hypothetical protein